MVSRCVSRCISFVFICFCWIAAARGDFDAGLKAYNARDFATALKEWQPLAEKGAPHAQYNLGLMYARGQGVPQDFTKAADFYQKAAGQGVIEAEYNLGVLYSSGQGVKKDDAEAMKWFLKAAEKGDVNAANNIGTIYDEGPGAFKNYAEAEKWYRKAAESGNSNSQFSLGIMYDLGQGVKQDYSEALKWYTKAADQGNAGALCNIAVLYYNGQGVPVDRVQSHRYFLLAKELGEPRADNLIKLTTEKLNKKQLSQAIQLASDWKAAHPIKQGNGLTPPPEQTVVAAADPVAPPVTPAVSAAASGPASPAPATIGTPAPALQTAFTPSSQSVWTGVARVIAIADLHGDYPELVKVLRSAGLIDGKNDWVGGKSHLVQTGDILDRGANSRQIMDLLIKLQRQARDAGGYVHCLLGNHEVMNIYGDLRYVSPGEYAAFVTPDSEKKRDQEYENFRRQSPNSPMSKDEWNRIHPLGFFEHRAAFSSDGVYGKWLRSLNTAIRVDDTLFVHAGLSSKYASVSLDELNRRVRNELNDPRQFSTGVLTDQDGPFWYRGIAKGDEKALMPVVDATLENDGAKREAIGHTYARAAITPRFDGKVILVDIGLPRVYDNIEKLGCLLIENGKPYALHRGHKLELPKDEDGPDTLRYLKEAAALDPAPSPLISRVETLEKKIGSATP